MRMMISLWNLLASLHILILNPLLSSGEDSVESGEKRLIANLVEKSTRANQLGRPVSTSNCTVHLDLDLYLIQILNLNEKNQVLTTSVWLTMSWSDPMAKWEPENYEGVNRISLDKSLLWTPDIALYNYADERLQEQRNAMLVLTSDGTISWIPTAIYKSYCRIDITDFPFDEQFCFIKIGSWTYTERQLNISFRNQSSPMNLGDYTVSNEWDLIESPGRLFVSDYFDDRYPYLIYFLLELSLITEKTLVIILLSLASIHIWMGLIKFSFSLLRRKSAFTACLLVLPCVLLASLTLVIFLLPPESPAKMVLGMNIFVAFFLLLLLLADNTPQASTSVPHLGIYFCMNMMLITFSSFLTVCVINSYFRGDNTNRVPDCILRILIRIGALPPVPDVLQEDLNNYSSKRRHLIRNRNQRPSTDHQKELNPDGLLRKDGNHHNQNNHHQLAQIQSEVSQKSVIFENVKDDEHDTNNGRESSLRRKGLKSQSASVKSTRRRNVNSTGLSIKDNKISGKVHRNHFDSNNLQSNNGSCINQTPGVNNTAHHNKEPICSMFPGSCYCGTDQATFFNDSSGYLVEDQSSKPTINHHMDSQFCSFCAQDSQFPTSYEMLASSCPLCKAPNGQALSAPPLINRAYPLVNANSFNNNNSMYNNNNCRSSLMMRNPLTTTMSSCHSGPGTINGPVTNGVSDWENNLKEIQKSLKDFQDKIHKKEIAARISKEWRCVATVLDRIFLAMYFVIQLLAILFIIPRANKKIDERVTEFENEFFPQGTKQT